MNPPRSLILPCLSIALFAHAADSELLRDFDHDGVNEKIIGHEIQTWNASTKSWQAADYSLPPDCTLTDDKGGDNGLRFIDLNGDGFDDVIQSNERGFAIYLWAGTVKANLGWAHGWPHLVAKGDASASAKVLPFVKDGRDLGAVIDKDSITWPGSPAVRKTYREIIAFDMPAPKSPDESLKAMQPRPGFVAELVASEPLIEGPVNFDWDAQGRLWVVEMPDYPLGMDGQGKPGGMVKLLTDSVGDGHYDKATTVLDGIPFPSGLTCWRDGAIISASPSIVYVEYKEEHTTQKVLFTGFREGNQQHRVNGFDWGLDGWVYGANGDSGGTINGISISGRDFRFKPDTGEFEPESGGTQYSRKRDDWDNWFGNNNPAWLWHYTISDPYLRRNPKLAVKTTKQMLANYTDSTRVFAISELPIRFNQPQSLGHVTSGCSATPYRDDLFGIGFATSVFACEPVHNVVHREVLTPEGATFTSKRADDEQEREFLASKDPWFRPVMAKTGPDGALYVADFYRFVLEHPEWIAPETQARLNLRAGADKGRLYRIYPKGVKLRPAPNLAKLNNLELAAAMDSMNGWQRDTVQRLLRERDAKDAAPVLQQLAMQAPQAKVRVQALATLQTINALTAEALRSALSDPSAHVRVQALRCCESFPTSTSILQGIMQCADDSEFMVRHQCALSLGAFSPAAAHDTLTKLADRDGDQPQMRIAIMSSLKPEDALFAKLNKAAPANAAPAIVLPKASTPDRAKVVASYALAATLKGDAAHGHEVFKANCLVCHRLKGEGMEVGPDLAMVADKPTDWLLVAIFDPNAAIEDRFKAQTLKLKNHTELSGIISAETANNVVLRLPGGVEMPVLRSEVASQAASGRSLMPEGMETVLKPQDVADLIAWIRAK